MYQQQNQQPSFTQSQYGSTSSQGRYQPMGNVQSYYQGMGNSSQSRSSNSIPYTSSGFQSQSGSQSQSGYSQGGFSGTESFHTASYQGNQPGHDNYLRADSVNPTSQGFNSGYQSSFQSGIGSQQPGQFSSYGGSATTGSYQTASYRGDQPGHDAYLRSDSTNPSSSGFSGVGGSQFQFQSQSPQGYQTSQYVGNQPGHDQYLRADSTQPSQIQSGTSQYGRFR